MALQGFDQLNAIYTAIIGREQDQASLEGILRVKDAFGLAYDDPRLAIFMCNDSYKTLFVDVQNNAQQAVDFVLEDAQRRLAKLVDDQCTRIASVGERLDAEFLRTSEKYFAFTEKNAKVITARTLEAMTASVKTDVSKEISQAIRKSLDQEIVPLRNGLEREFGSLRATIHSFAQMLQETEQRMRTNWLSHMIDCAIAGAVGGLVVVLMPLFIKRFVG